MNYFYQFLILFSGIFQLLVLIRAVLSWFNPKPGPFTQFIVEVTDPILLPIRAVLPKSAVLDFSPLVAIILLEIIGQLAAAML